MWAMSLAVCFGLDYDAIFRCRFIWAAQRVDLHGALQQQSQLGDPVANKDKEVMALSFKIRRLGLRALETARFLGQTSPTTLLSNFFDKEVVTSLSYVGALGFRGSRVPLQLRHPHFEMAK